VSLISESFPCPTACLNIHATARTKYVKRKINKKENGKAKCVRHVCVNGADNVRFARKNPNHSNSEKRAFTDDIKPRTWFCAIFFLDELVSESFVHEKDYTLEKVKILEIWVSRMRETDPRVSLRNNRCEKQRFRTCSRKVLYENLSVKKNE